uniref:EGF-like domain-containing protein n=1 Tax=Anabas testudineus TaxID=64144 RepID=A0A7N6A8D0_ANATE
MPGVLYSEKDLHINILKCDLLIGATPDRLPPTVDLCSPNPCQNRAICRSHRDSYSCFCVPGFQGSHCQIDVNECISQPCKNGATCVDRVGTFSCLCSPGFTGATCEVQIDECQSQPCLSGGSCHDYAGGFACTCLPGFQGHQYCEIPLPPCHSQPCFNSAICENDQGNYTCKCWPGKTQDTTFKEQMRDEKCKERRICPKSSNYVTMAP